MLDGSLGLEVGKRIALPAAGADEVDRGAPGRDPEPSAQRSALERSAHCLVGDEPREEVMDGAFAIDTVDDGTDPARHGGEVLAVAQLEPGALAPVETRKPPLGRVVAEGRQGGERQHGRHPIRVPKPQRAAGTVWTKAFRENRTRPRGDPEHFVLAS